MLPYNRNLKQYSRELRRNMTDAERLLWLKIRRKQLNEYQFYRQKVIGNYIVDFYCPKAGLIIELDGGQHYSSKGEVNDRKRDAYMKRLGLRVLRFSDKEVLKNLKGVLEAIWQKLKSPFIKGGLIRWKTFIKGEVNTIPFEKGHQLYPPFEKGHQLNYPL